jgi:hypothetical protein
MNRTTALRVAASFALALLIGPVSAGYNSTVTGTLNFIQQMSTTMSYSPETVVFALTNQPTFSCGSGFSYFIISPNSVTDAQTRKNMMGLLMMAKSTGAQVIVGYDKASVQGGSCDQGYAMVYWLEVQ